MSLHVAPAMRCQAPAKTFRDQELERALEYARRAAHVFQVGYAIFQVTGGRPRLVRRIARPLSSSAVSE